MKGLFREEALQAQRSERLGVISLATPLGFLWWALLAAALAAALVLFLIFGHYTRRETVSGQLRLSAGLLTLSSQTTGTVSRTLVHEGQAIRAGQPLVEVSANVMSTSIGNPPRFGNQESQKRIPLTNLQSPARTERRDLRARIAMLQTQVDQIKAQLTQSEAAESAMLRAPIGGVISTLLVKAGQKVTRGQPMLSILPRDSKVEAELLVPSYAVGYVRLGSQVVLRYQAFPYQTFGQQYGKVVHISHIALTTVEANELTGHALDTATPLYKVLVSLDRQMIGSYGHAEPLIPGMTVSGDILLGRTSLWAWVFDPLHTLRQQSTRGGHAG